MHPGYLKAPSRYHVLIKSLIEGPDAEVESTIVKEDLLQNVAKRLVNLQSLRLLAGRGGSSHEEWGEAVMDMLKKLGPVYFPLREVAKMFPTLSRMLSYLVARDKISLVATGCTCCHGIPDGYNDRCRTYFSETSIPTGIDYMNLFSFQARRLQSSSSSVPCRTIARSPFVHVSLTAMATLPR